MGKQFGRCPQTHIARGKEYMLGVQMEHLLTTWSVKQAEQNSLKTIKGVPRAVSHPPVSRGPERWDQGGSTAVCRGSSVGGASGSGLAGVNGPFEMCSCFN